MDVLRRIVEITLVLKFARGHGINEERTWTGAGSYPAYESALICIVIGCTFTFMVLSCGWCYKWLKKPSEGEYEMGPIRLNTDIYEEVHANNLMPETNNNGPLSMDNARNMANNTTSIYIINELESRNNVGPRIGSNPPNSFPDLLPFHSTAVNVTPSHALPTPVRDAAEPSNGEAHVLQNCELIRDCSDWFECDYGTINRKKLQYIREIGKGWFGRIVLSDYNVNQKEIIPVAVKILNQNVSIRDRCQFLNECKLFRDVKHYNVKRLLGYGQETPWSMVFEYNGQDMKEYLCSEKKNARSLIEKGVPTRLMTEIADALSFIHSKGFVHGDISCRCVDIRMKNQKPEAVLGGLGESASRYPADYCHGIPLRWIAPEQIVQAPFHVSMESDVWSLGVFMWETCKFGERPFDIFSDEIVSEGLRAHLEQDSDIKPLLLTPSFNIFSDSFKSNMNEILLSCWQPMKSRKDALWVVNQLRSLATLPAIDHTSTVTSEIDFPSFEPKTEAVQSIVKKSPGVENFLAFSQNPSTAANWPSFEEFNGNTETGFYTVHTTAILHNQTFEDNFVMDEDTDFKMHDYNEPAIDQNNEVVQSMSTPELESNMFPQYANDVEKSTQNKTSSNSDSEENARIEAVQNELQSQLPNEMWSKKPCEPGYDLGPIPLKTDVLNVNNLMAETHNNRTPAMGNASNIVNTSSSISIINDLESRNNFGPDMGSNPPHSFPDVWPFHSTAVNDMPSHALPTPIRDAAEPSNGEAHAVQNLDLNRECDYGTINNNDRDNKSVPCDASGVTLNNLEQAVVTIPLQEELIGKSSTSVIDEVSVVDPILSQTERVNNESVPSFASEVIINNLGKPIVAIPPLQLLMEKSSTSVNDERSAADLHLSQTECVNIEFVPSYESGVTLNKLEQAVVTIPPQEVPKMEKSSTVVIGPFENEGLELFKGLKTAVKEVSSSNNLVCIPHENKTDPTALEYKIYGNFTKTEDSTVNGNSYGHESSSYLEDTELNIHYFDASAIVPEEIQSPLTPEHKSIISPKCSNETDSDKSSNHTDISLGTHNDSSSNSDAERKADVDAAIKVLHAQLLLAIRNGPQPEASYFLYTIDEESINSPFSNAVEDSLEAETTQHSIPKHNLNEAFVVNEEEEWKDENPNEPVQSPNTVSEVPSTQKLMNSPSTPSLKSWASNDTLFNLDDNFDEQEESNEIKGIENGKTEGCEGPESDTNEIPPPQTEEILSDDERTVTCTQIFMGHPTLSEQTDSVALLQFQPASLVEITMNVLRNMHHNTELFILNPSFNGDLESPVDSGNKPAKNTCKEKDWDSDSEDSSNSEFVWKECDSGASCDAPATIEFSHQTGSPKQDLQWLVPHESPDSSDTEFVPSSWDRAAEPTKSSIRRSLSKECKKKVAFKQEICPYVYEYPRETPEFEHDMSSIFPDSSTYAEWRESDHHIFDPLLTRSANYIHSPYPKNFPMGDDLFVSSTARPLRASEFCPAKSFPDRTTPDSGVDDLTPAGTSVSWGNVNDASSPKPISSQESMVFTTNMDLSSTTGLGELRHTRDKLTLLLPPAPLPPRQNAKTDPDSGED